ncbi:MAG: MMPL family transporter [candidate division WOR-3 bacterium]|nr:MAG: MMPL family transporter [candidate division WOR-3 bacterium]
MKQKLLRRWGRFAARHPWWIIGVLLALTVVCAGLASNLKLNMRYADMLPSDDPKAQEFDRILTEFKTASSTIIVVQGEEGAMKRFVERIVPRIRELDTLVAGIDYRVDREFLGNHGFMLAEADDLDQSVGMFKDLSLVPFLTQLNDDFEQEYSGDQEALSTRVKEEGAVRALDGLEYWLRTMDRYVAESGATPAAVADTAVDRLLFGDPYFISHDKRAMIVTVRPTFSAMDIDKCVLSTRLIREYIAEAQQEFPDVHAGLTGTIAIQADEQYHVGKDIGIGVAVALLLVLALFILTFRMWASPILAALNLLIGIVITAGVASIYPGRLTPFTAMFAVILVGLGIDYAIHIISLYTERRQIDPDAATAMEEALARSGSGVITGALTTAIAFAALAVSSTLGIREMGIVLGLGIFTTMVVTVVGLPAFLSARERVLVKLKRGKPLKHRHVEFSFLSGYGRTVVRRPWVFLVIALVLTGFFVYQASKAKFDPNMMNMEPEGMESVVLYDTLENAFEFTPDFAMVAANSIEESYAIAESAKAMPSFSMVENIGDFVPPREKQLERQPAVRRLREELAAQRRSEPVTRASIGTVVRELERLDANIYELAQLAYTGGQDRVDAKAKSIIGDPEAEEAQSVVLALADRIKADPGLAARTLGRFQQHYWPKLRARAMAMANPELIELEDVPDDIRRRFVSESGEDFLVTIYTKKMIWDFEVLRRFNKQLDLVDPKITGTPPIMQRLMDSIARDGVLATILTILIVFGLLWLDFRSLRLALLGMIPLIAGGIWMVGILKTFGMMFTMLNVMGIPMIVGIGIDDGVHIVHRYRIEGFLKTPLVLASTGKAVLLTSLTTIAGFGSLMITSYRGFISLGALLSFGVGACFLTTVLFLPSIICIWHRRKQARTDLWYRPR